jgi:hypothetical protein
VSILDPKQENEQLDRDNQAKTVALREAGAKIAELEARNTVVERAFVEHRSLAEEAQQALAVETLALTQKSTECDLLHKENLVTHKENHDLSRIRDTWEERQDRETQLATARNFYELRFGAPLFMDRAFIAGTDPSFSRAAVPWAVPAGYPPAALSPLRRYSSPGRRRSPKR